ncbi:MAG TPA: hypothetical protein VIM51_01680 [Desulfosporosinus sp.]
MKQLFIENSINLDTVLFDLQGRPYTVNMFLLLLKGRGTTEIVKSKLVEYFGTKFDDNDKVLAYIMGVSQNVLGITNMSKENYVRELEAHTKPMVSLLEAQVDKAEASGDFNIFAEILPGVDNALDLYAKLGEGYYSQTCADFLGLYVRIQNGLGDHTGATVTQDTLDVYLKHK